MPTIPKRENAAIPQLTATYATQRNCVKAGSNANETAQVVCDLPRSEELTLVVTDAKHAVDTTLLTHPLLVYHSSTGTGFLPHGFEWTPVAGLTVPKDDVKKGNLVKSRVLADGGKVQIFSNETSARSAYGLVPYVDIRASAWADDYDSGNPAALTANQHGGQVAVAFDGSRYTQPKFGGEIVGAASTQASYPSVLLPALLGASFLLKKFL